MALGRLSKLKAFLNISGTTDDNDLKMYLKAATKVAETYCHSSFESTTHTEYYDGSGDRFLHLRKKNATALTSVHEGEDWDELVPSTDYRFMGDKGSDMIIHDNLWNAGVKNYKVIYTAGYTTTNWDNTSTMPITSTFGTVPIDLEHAVILITARMYQNSKKGGAKFELEELSRDAELQRFTPESKSQSSIIPKSAEGILNRYRRLSSF
tara:strand:+ start:3811 stop:4437 length:627 start_codon:yes stop_codon:yes gene_type:complete